MGVFKRTITNKRLYLDLAFKSKFHSILCHATQNGSYTELTINHYCRFYYTLWNKYVLGISVHKYFVHSWKLEISWFHSIKCSKIQDSGFKTTTIYKCLTQDGARLFLFYLHTWFKQQDESACVVGKQIFTVLYHLPPSPLAAPLPFRGRHNFNVEHL